MNRPLVSSGVERIYLAALAVFVIAIALAHVRYYFKGPQLPSDLTAFYCGGKIALHHADPYEIEPLLSCEEQLTQNGRLLRVKPFPPYGTPVPLPPYDFAPLALIALLPISIAKAFFGVLELGAMFATGFALSKLSRLPFAVTLGIALFGTGYGAQLLGQLAPFAIAALALSALAFRQGRMTWGAIAVCVALIQPQFGAPAVFGAILLYPKARLTVAASLGALAAVGLAFGGVHRIIEYLKVLPLHARAEIAFAPQYSLSFALHQLGVNTTIALTLGSISYVVMVVASLLLLYFTKDAAMRSGAGVLLPAAFSVLGGTFIHSYQIAVAILVAVVLTYSKWSAIPVSIALTLLVCPWGNLASVPLSKSVEITVLLTLIVVASMIFYLQKGTFGNKGSAVLALACAAIALGVFSALHASRPIRLGMEATNIVAPALPPTALGSVGWGEGIRLMDLTNPAVGTLSYNWTHWFVKIPEWLALLLLLPSVANELLATRRLKREITPS